MPHKEAMWDNPCQPLRIKLSPQEMDSCCGGPGESISSSSNGSDYRCCSKLPCCPDDHDALRTGCTGRLTLYPYFIISPYARESQHANPEAIAWMFEYRCVTGNRADLVLASHIQQHPPSPHSNSNLFHQWWIVERRVQG